MVSLKGTLDVAWLEQRRREQNATQDSGKVENEAPESEHRAKSPAPAFGVTSGSKVTSLLVRSAIRRPRTSSKKLLCLAPLAKFPGPKFSLIDATDAQEFTRGDISCPVSSMSTSSDMANLQPTSIRASICALPITPSRYPNADMKRRSKQVSLSPR
jgi:hypothetical protein